MTRNIITLLDVPVDVIASDGLIERCCAFIREKKKSRIMYANVHTLNIAFEDKGFKEVLKKADLVYCDGEGVRRGARLQGKFLPSRMTGADWIWELCATCEKRGYTMYFLGGEPGIAEKAAKNLIAKYPGLKIIGSSHGYFQKKGNESDRIISLINKMAPDILLVGFGSPMQEKWISNNFEKIDARVVWGVGALMDFVSGKVPRAPQWMRDNGMEWLFRLSIEPQRMWRRYLLGNVVYLFRIIKEKYGFNHKMPKNSQAAKGRLK